MYHHLIVVALIGLFSSGARADPFASGDVALGKWLVEKHCISCHASSFGGDGSMVYLRENRLVKDAKGLLAQIRRCNTNLNLRWFEEEELHVAAYLNQLYYKFDK